MVGKTPDFKFASYMEADIADSDTPVSKDGYLAFELHRAGLECIHGQIIMNVHAQDPVMDILRDEEFKKAIRLREAEGKPVYLGPSAVFAAGRLAVFSSDKVSTSLGVWTPRAGVELDPGAIN